MKIFSKKILIYFISIMFIVTLLIVLIDFPVAEKNNETSFIIYLEQSLPKYLKRYTTAGAAVGLIHNSEIVFLKGYGFADLENHIPVTKKTLFQVASVSKPVTSVGVMKLIEQGKLNLDSPVKQYLTRWKFPPEMPFQNEITIRRLLSHTAGLSNPPDGYSGSTSPYNLPTIEESLSDPREGVFIEYQPGTKYLYSGVGFTLLQLTIEEVTSLDFNDYMTKELFIPLQMNNSTFDFEEVDQTKLAIVYDDNGNPLKSLYFTEKAAAGLYTDVNDLAKFVLSMMDNKNINNSILSTATKQIMFFRQEGIKNVCFDGLGFSLLRPFFRNYYEVYHYGTNGPGWCSLISFFPDKKEGIVVLTNSPGGQAIRYQIRTSWLNWVTGSSNIIMKIQKAVNTLKITILITIFGVLMLIILLFIRYKIKPSK